MRNRVAPVADPQTHRANASTRLLGLPMTQGKTGLSEQPAQAATVDRRRCRSMFVAQSIERIVGLRGWDDFIVQDGSGDSFALPTVPCDATDLIRYRVPSSNGLIPDDRFAGKVK